MADLPTSADLHARLDELVAKCQAKISLIEGMEREIETLESPSTLHDSAAEVETLQREVRRETDCYETLLARAQRQANSPFHPAPAGPPMQPHFFGDLRPHRRPDTLPLFRSDSSNGIKDPQDFIEKFEASCFANGVPVLQWSTFLVDSVRIQEMRFVKSICVPNVPWEAVKHQFLEHYFSPHIESARLTELINLSMKAKESVQEFGDRFITLMEKCRISPDDEGYKQMFAKKIWSYNSYLWSAVLQFKVSNPYCTVYDLVSVATEHEAGLELRNHPAFTPPSCPPQGKLAELKKKQYCAFHRAHGNHSTEQCRARQLQSAVPRPQSSQQATRTHQSPVHAQQSGRAAALGQAGGKDLSSVQCYKCKGLGHYASNCTRSTIYQLEASHVHDGFSEEELDALCRDHYSVGSNVDHAIIQHINTTEALTSHNDPDPPIEIPVLCDVKQVIAQVDTGASHTVLSKRVADQLGLDYKPTSSIQLAHSSTTCEGWMLSCAASVCCNNRELRTRLRVMELNRSTNMLLGRDLLAKFGIAVSYLPFASTEVSAIQPVSPDDEIDFRPPRVFQSTPEYDGFRQIVLEEVRDALAANQAIPLGTFCTAPGSDVKLETSPGKRAYRVQYPLPEMVKPFVSAQVQEWLAAGIIKLAPAGCEWNSPLTYSFKKLPDGRKIDIRTCFDARGVNELLESIDKHPLPTISHVHRAYKGKKFLSAFDLKWSFHQFLVYLDHQFKLAFTWNGVQYCFVGCPFGLTPISHHVQRVIQSALHSLQYCSRVFIDDITVFSDTLEQHVTDVRNVLTTLNAINLKLRLDKCYFAYPAIRSLGYIVSSVGAVPDSVKVEEAQAFPIPVTGTNVASFVGLVNFFREHIPGFAHIAAPLDRLRQIKGSISHLWTSECQVAFQRLKECLLSASILHHYDDSLPLFLACDASNVGVGVILFQRSHTNDFRLLRALSSTLKGGQRNYSATQRELLAIIYGMRKCHDFIWGRHFTLITDHKALVYMLKQANPHSMLLRYFDTIISYDFDVVHCPGIENVLPDAMSRLYPVQQPAINPNSTVTINQLISISPRAALKEIKGLVFVDSKDERRAILEREHQKGHFGTDIVIENVIKSQKLYWPDMRKECEQICQSCAPCQRFNVYQHGFNPLQSILADMPFDHVCIDLGQGPCTSSSGNNYFLLVVDVCSRFVLLRPLRTKSADEVGAELFYLFTCFGFPKILQSDNGTEFVNQIIRTMARSYKIEHRVTTPYNPRANGTAEIHVKVTKSVIYKSINGDDAAWDKALAPAQLAINTRISRRHGSTPFAVMFGRMCNGFQDYSATRDGQTGSPLAALQHLRSQVFPAVAKRATDSARQDAERHDASKRIIRATLVPGSLVMAVNDTRGSKAEPRYEGPYTIVRVNKGGAFVLQDQTGQLLGRKFSISQLKPAQAPPGVAGQESLVVKTIMNHRGDQNNREYFVRWSNYPAVDDSWEPPSSFDDIQVIRQYWKNRQSEAPQLLYSSPISNSTNKRPSPIAAPHPPRAVAPIPRIPSPRTPGTSTDLSEQARHSRNTTSPASVPATRVSTRGRPLRTPRQYSP